MRTFEEIVRYVLKGRGLVISVQSDTDSREWLHELIGTVVLISGTPYKVKGIESHAKATISIGDPIGLLVDKLSDNIFPLKWETQPWSEFSPDTQEQMDNDEDLLFEAWYIDDLVDIHIGRTCHATGMEGAEGWYDGSKYIHIKYKNGKREYEGTVFSIEEGMQKAEELYVEHVNSLKYEQQ